MNPQASEFVPSWMASSPEQPQQQEGPAQASWEDEDPSTPLEQPAEEISQTKVSNDPTNSSSPPKREQKRPGNSSAADQRRAAKKATNTDTVPAEQKSVETNPISSEVPLPFDLSNLDLDEKRPINVVLLGHVDAGKSTISGHLLVLTGNVDERTMEKYEKEAKALNRESWKFAFALDTSEQEREKGKTEECGQASFNTDTRRFTILDAPGHKNYVPHMIGGASQADIGILVISARKGEFETGFERGGQTREHAMLAKSSGVRQMIVVINKLDDLSVTNPDGSWSQERFLECKTKLEPYLKNVGWNPRTLVWIPVSGLTGHNLKLKPPSEICPWYDGESLLDTLENLPLPDRLTDGPVKMPISEKHKEMGTMVMGKLESGVVQLNDTLVMMPNRVEVVVDSVQLEGSTAQAAEPGDVVRLRLKGIDDDEVVILEHKSIICAGYSAVIHIHAAVEEIVIEQLLAELNKAGKAKQKHPKFVKPKMRCLARLRTSQPVCIEPYNVFPQLGRFMIRDEGKTVAVGTVLKVL